MDSANKAFISFLLFLVALALCDMNATNREVVVAENAVSIDPAKVTVVTYTIDERNAQAIYDAFNKSK